MHTTLKRIIIFLLTLEAKLVLRRKKPKIVAVTGSAGKTSTKDAIFAVLSNGRYVRRSEKSYNSEFGVPLTILGLESGWNSPMRWFWNVVAGARIALTSGPYPEWLVLEVGADRPGDIKSIAEWLKPDIAVITSIPDVPVHVEYFDSPAQLAAEKRNLAAHLRHDGILVINGDDQHTQRIAEEFRESAVTFGLGGYNAFVATDVGVLYEEKKPAGMHFYVEHSGARIPVALYGALGTPRVFAALAALAVAEVVGIALEEAADSLRALQPAPGRMRLIPGLKGSLIIDDTYNSSPVAAHAALEMLHAVKGFKRRIAVLGDMLELGRYSKDAHKDVGRHAARTADALITVGLRARAIAECAMDHGLPEAVVRQYEQGESERAGKELEAELIEGTLVLVKGSQGMRMEKTVLDIMEEPARARELLVRQDADWKTR